MLEDGPDARLAAALTALAANHHGVALPAYAEVLAALVTARVFAAITATSTAEHVDAGTGLRAESSAEMALLTLVGSRGGRALPVFLRTSGAVGLRPGARPVARTGQQVCAAALQDGAVAVILEPAGAAVTVTGSDLREIAAGRVPVTGSRLSSRRVDGGLTTPVRRDEDLLTALSEALLGEPVQAARLLDGPDGPVLGVVPNHPLDAPGLTALAARVLPRLPGRPVDLTVVSYAGPGLDVLVGPPRPRWRR